MSALLVTATDPTPDPDDDRPGWMTDAACAEGQDPDVWFPEKHAHADIAREICFRCPVRVDCLTHAVLANEEHGIWGGLSRRERLELVAKFGLRHGTTAPHGTPARSAAGCGCHLCRLQEDSA